MTAVNSLDLNSRKLRMGQTGSVSVQLAAINSGFNGKGRWAVIGRQEILHRLDIKNYYQSCYPELKINNEWGQAHCNLNSHQDHKPSLFVNFSSGMFHCKGCGIKGSVFDHYMKMHNVDYRSALHALAKEAGLTTETARRIAKTYNYVDEPGNLLFQTVRYEPKDFKQRRPDGKGGWIYNLKDVRLVPYNLPEVTRSESIIIVEGEKDADNLNAIGLIATCNPMGANKWRPEYNQYFKDKEITIIPDTDKPGRDHALSVAKNLLGIAESVKIIDLPDLPEKGDVTDWIESKRASGISDEQIKTDLLQIIENTEFASFSDIYSSEKTEKLSLSFLRKGSDLINLECNIEWVIDRLIPKQSITLLHGRGGIGKTWISLILANAVSKGISFMDLSTDQMPVVFVDFENSLPVLVERVKKITASDVLFWHNTNEVKPPKLDREEWEQYKSLPIGLLIFDTLRASQSKDENDSKDMAFVMSRLKDLRDMGFTIVLLHHTPKSNDRTYKGSTAIMDLADHVLSLYKVKRGNLEDTDDDDEEGYFRLGTKEKTRYEPFHIFLDFDPDKGFVLAPDPDEEDMKAIHALIIELKETKGNLPIQGQITEKVKEELGLSKNKIGKLLKKGEGKYWNSSHVPERKNAKVYKPISVFQFSNTIYSRETEKLPEAVNQLSNDNLPENIQENLDNSEFASFPTGIQETEKQVEIPACVEGPGACQGKSTFKLSQATGELERYCHAKKEWCWRVY